MPTKRPVSSVSVFLQKTDGRDALIKVFQFTALTLSYFAAEASNQDIAARALIMFFVCKNARRLLRMFRGFVEYNRLMEISGFIGQSFFHNTMILTRVFFILWMFFDNLALLAELKTLTSDDRPLNKLACIFWTAELITQGMNRASQLYIDMKSRVSHKLRFSTLTLDAEISHNLLKQKKLLSMVYQSIWKLLSIFLNIFAALQCTYFIDDLFGFNFNNGLVGITSLVAAAIEGYQVYNGAMTDNLT